MSSNYNSSTYSNHNHYYQQLYQTKVPGVTGSGQQIKKQHHHKRFLSYNSSSGIIGHTTCSFSTNLNDDKDDDNGFVFLNDSNNEDGNGSVFFNYYNPLWDYENSSNKDNTEEIRREYHDVSWHDLPDANEDKEHNIDLMSWDDVSQADGKSDQIHEDHSTFSSFHRKSVVHFHPNLVTEIYTIRPLTSNEDKAKLYFSCHELQKCRDK